MVVVGAGMGGLAAAIGLAARGLAVELVDRGAVPGGKLRTVEVSGRAIDSGPTVFTMPDVLRDLFRAAGDDLDARVRLRRAEILARHAWSPDERLDLFADARRSEAAIEVFAGAEAASGFRRFVAAARRSWNALDEPFLRRPSPSPWPMLARNGIALPLRIDPFRSLWRSLGRFFPDPRLHQLFGRYATYVGSSPFEAPATLMLVAEVERAGVWLVEGGMIRLAEETAALAARLGVRLRGHCPVREILVEHGRAAGVVLADGERIGADAVVCNADISALGDGAFGAAAARGARVVLPGSRSFSALTWSGIGRLDGFVPSRHTVLFSRDSPTEFAALRRGGMPDDPTIYLCAQDRDDCGERLDGGTAGDAERVLLIANAPPFGDTLTLEPEELERCRAAMTRTLERCGLGLAMEEAIPTQPAQFHRMFPGTGGALYGRSARGWRATFRRPGVRSPVPNLFLAGGSAHPGPGLSMAALSGRMAAEAVLAALSPASTRRSPRTAIAGGISMPSTTKAATD